MALNVIEHFVNNIWFAFRNVYGNVKLNIIAHVFLLTDLMFYINNMFYVYTIYLCHPAEGPQITWFTKKLLNKTFHV